MHRLARVMFTCLCGLLANVAGAQTSKSAHVDRFRDLAERAVAAKDCVGLSIAIMRGEEWLVADGFGSAELEHGVAADAETVFRIGSLTKQFTAAAIMQLVERDKLSLDTDFREYLTEYPDPGVPITVRHLLTHTSGIPSYTSQLAWRRTIPLELSADELLAYVRSKKLEFEPGSSFRYCNTGYFLLGLLIEKASGQSYAEYLSTELLTPLGLTRTRLGSNTDLIPNRAQGYRVVGGKIENDMLLGMSQPYAAGALLSSAKDLVAWSRALRDGKVVSRESYRQMTTAHVLPNGEDTGYGFGLMIGERNDEPCIFHGGGINGFNSFLALWPERDLTVAVLSNSEAASSGELAEPFVFAARAATAARPTNVDAVADGPSLSDRIALGKLPVTHCPPTDWIVEKSSSSMRLAQFRVPGASKRSCVVYWFGTGGGGGKSANLERWRGQFADDAVVESSDLDVASAGIQATVLDVEGTYRAETRPGSGRRVNEPEWAMLAAYVEVPEGPVYLKLVGPKADVATQRAAFTAWIRSFRAK